MKSSKAKKIKGSTDANAMPVVAEVVPVGYSYTEPTSNDPAERIKYHLSQAHVAASVAMRHIIEAGWELAKQKRVLGFGQWNAWCQEKLDISRFTADKYIATFHRTVGVERALQSVSLEAKLLKKELDAATVGMEEKTVRQAMIELGVIKAAKSWGGKREGAGCKPKGEAETVAEKLEAIANNETLLWQALKGALDTLVKMDAEKDIWNRLDDNHLADAVGILAEAAKKSSNTMMKRIG